MMKNLLVLTDFSIQAQNALKFAVEVAQMNGAKIHLLYVAEVYLNALDPVFENRESHDYGVDKLMKLKQKGTERLLKIEKVLSKKVDITTRCEIGDFLNISMEFIAENKIDQVIMGSSEMSRIREWLFGSKAKKITRFAPCPVLTLNKFVSPSTVKKIVFGINMTNSASNALEKLKSCQSLFQASLEIVLIKTHSIFKDEKLIIKQMEGFAQINGLTNYNLHIRKNSAAVSGLLKITQEIGADMVVLGKRNRTGLSHFFFGSVSENIVKRSPWPVLTSGLEFA